MNVTLGIMRHVQASTHRSTPDLQTKHIDVLVLCNAPNHTTVLYDFIDSTESNTFTMLSLVSIQSESDTSNVENSFFNLSIGEPIATSFPVRSQKPWPRSKTKKGVCTLIINFQSIKNKRTELPVLKETAQPDAIIGTETWLSEEIGNREIFPPELCFDIIRRDRPGYAHGGVLLAAKSELGLTQLHMISDSIQLDKKKVVLCSFYRPPNMQKADYTEKVLDENTTVKPKDKNGILLLGGDVNLPDFNWIPNCITGKQLQLNVNQAFLQKTANLSLQQVNVHPTRGETSWTSSLPAILPISRDVRPCLRWVIVTTTSC